MCTTPKVNTQAGVATRTQENSHQRSRTLSKRQQNFMSKHSNLLPLLLCVTKLMTIINHQNKQSTVFSEFIFGIYFRNLPGRWTLFSPDMWTSPYSSLWPNFQKNTVTKLFDLNMRRLGFSRIGQCIRVQILCCLISLWISIWHMSDMIYGKILIDQTTW